MKQYDVLIVGGGVLGAFHAYQATMRGLSVALLEKSAFPQGSTVRNFGQIVPSGMNRRWQAFGRESLAIYQSIQQQFDISARQNGSVYLASDEEEMTLLEELAQINRDQDYTSELLTAQQCKARFAPLRTDYCRGGLLFPQEITLEPRVAIQRILSYLTEVHGVAFFPKTLVVSIENKGSACNVWASDGRQWQAERVLVCGGYDFQTLYPTIYATSDVQAVKIQMLLLEAQLQQQLPGSILTGLSIRRYEAFHECASYKAIKAKEDPNSPARQWGIHILFKQAVDGSIILGDSHEYADAAQSDDLGFDVNEDINRHIIDYGKSILDLQSWQVQQAWFGIYAQSKSGDIFHYKVDDRIQIITGIGGKGMTGSAGYAANSPFFNT
jgi:FAD dependent oxidoreductase TIGR03364